MVVYHSPFLLFGTVAKYNYRMEETETMDQVEQYVMAYRVDHERVKHLLTEAYTSLRPVLRLNIEIITGVAGQRIRAEYNTPVESAGKRGWLNLITWESDALEMHVAKEGKQTTFTLGEKAAPFLNITFERVGKEGGCPKEDDNDGTFFVDATTTQTVFQAAEQIDNSKEYCDCELSWAIPTGPAFGAKEALVKAAMKLPNEQILGAYVVSFERALRRP